MRVWPVDPGNPGEVLACAGLAHLAWRADAEAATGFVRARGGGVRFVAPDATPLPESAGAWPLEPMEGPPHERIRFAGVALDWWCPWGLNPGLRNWSGTQSAWTVHRNLHRALGRSSASEWLVHSTPAAGGRLYLDPRSSWDTLELGFSLNAHRAYRMHVRPWVELLASVGLQAFAVPGHRARGGFRYRLWRPAPLTVAHATFASRSLTVETLAAYHVPVAKSGANAVLRRAHPEHGDAMS